jgi:hypothetical protein
MPHGIWDKGLKGLFTVNEWDGKSDTEIAVPIDELLPPEKGFDYIKHISTPGMTMADLKINGEFYKAFNEWLTNCRKMLR